MRFYFDFISPYAYLGWLQVHELAARHRRTVEPVPVLFAALLNTHGQKGPAEIPPKRIYTWKHVSRIAHDVGTTILPPPAHPFNPLLGLRIASLSLGDDERRKVIDTLYRMTWRDRVGITDPDVVAEALTTAGLPGPELVARAGAPEAKAHLRAMTEAAAEAGVFGVPTVEVDGEQFWGQDSFPHVDRFLAGDDPYDPASLALWEDLPAQAHRR